MERNSAKKWSFYGTCTASLVSDSLYILLWVVFSSAEWFGTDIRDLVSIFVPRNGILRCFLFHWRVRKGIPRVYFYFGSTKRNSELFSLPLKDSERNSESFLFRGTARIPSDITNCSVSSVFRRIIFLSEIPNPNFRFENTALGVAQELSFLDAGPMLTAHLMQVKFLSKGYRFTLFFCRSGSEYSIVKNIRPWFRSCD
jgi:hypothetical protein